MEIHNICFCFGICSFFVSMLLLLKSYLHYVYSGVWFYLKHEKTDIVWFSVCSLTFFLLGFLYKQEVYMSSLIILVLFGMAVALFSSWVKSKKETKAAELEEARQTKLAKAIAETVVKAIKDDLDCPCVITEKAGEKHDADTV